MAPRCGHLAAAFFRKQVIATVSDDAREVSGCTRGRDKSKCRVGKALGKPLHLKESGAFERAAVRVRKLGRATHINGQLVAETAHIMRCVGDLPHVVGDQAAL